MLYENFSKGINIGGWLSQYEFIADQPLTPENLKKHFNSFITETYIKRIAGWGFDHIRLPVSGYLVYDPKSDSLNTDTVNRIHQCIEWCRNYHLNIVLDLHDVWGNVYGAMQDLAPLLSDASLQNRFLKIWHLLAEEFKTIDKPVLLFELLNEVSDASGAYSDHDVTGKAFNPKDIPSFAWNKLCQKAVHKIRKSDPDRWILIGSNGQNSVVYLKEIQLINDPYVFYNFHFYDPQVFTHQRACFSEEMLEYNKVVSYPDDISGFITYLQTHPQYYSKYALVANERRNDKALMEKLLQYAIDFINTTGKELYCGEFGVINTAPVTDAAKWLHDFVEIMDRHHIGHAQWNYKYLDFGLLDLEGKPVSDLYKKVISYCCSQGNL